MKQTTEQFRSEFFRAAGPTLACAAILIGVIALPPAVDAVSHTLARMEAQRQHTPLSILDMTPGEKDAIMTKHHLQLLSDLHAQYLTMSAKTREAEQTEAADPSGENDQAVQVHEHCLGYIVNNYNGIAEQTPAAILDRDRLPRALP